MYEWPRIPSPQTGRRGACTGPQAIQLGATDEAAEHAVRSETWRRVSVPLDVLVVCVACVCAVRRGSGSGAATARDPRAIRQEGGHEIEGLKGWMDGGPQRSGFIQRCVFAGEASKKKLATRPGHLLHNPGRLAAKKHPSSSENGATLRGRTFATDVFCCGVTASNVSPTFQGGNPRTPPPWPARPAAQAGREARPSKEDPQFDQRLPHHFWRFDDLRTDEN